MKKMNQVRQALNTCSPLEKVIKINGALGTGVSTVSKKLYSESKNKSSCPPKNDGKSKDEKPVCRPCDQFEKPKIPDVCAKSDLPGCMPFTDNVPIKPIYPPPRPDPPLQCAKQLKKMKDKACGGCETQGTGVLPVEDDK